MDIAFPQKPNGSSLHVLKKATEVHALTAHSKSLSISKDGLSRHLERAQSVRNPPMVLAYMTSLEMSLNGAGTTMAHTSTWSYQEVRKNRIFSVTQSSAKVHREDYIAAIEAGAGISPRNTHSLFIGWQDVTT